MCGVVTRAIQQSPCHRQAPEPRQGWQTSIYAPLLPVENDRLPHNSPKRGEAGSARTN